MSGLDGLSREELLALLSAQARTIDVLTARLDALEVENAELKRRLTQNSRNSSKPPSSDGPETPPPRSLRRKTGRKPGKQPGARGFSLKLVDDPNKVLDHVPDRCRGCGKNLHDGASAGVVRRQVTDIAPALVTVTEHRLHQRRCGCGKITTAAAPEGVAGAPASYGPNLRAWVVYSLVSSISRSPVSSNWSPTSPVPDRRRAGYVRCCATPPRRWWGWRG